MKKFDFHTLASRFGEIIAYGHLEQIEVAAGISPREMVGLDPETRLANAFRLQDAVYASDIRMAA